MTGVTETVTSQFDDEHVAKFIEANREHFIETGELLPMRKLTTNLRPVRKAFEGLGREELEKLFEPQLVEKVVSTQARLESARLKLVELAEGPDQDEITKAAASLRLKEVVLQKAQWAYDEVAYGADIGGLPQAEALQEATLNYEAALADYNIAVRQPTAAEALAALAAGQAEAAIVDGVTAHSAAADGLKLVTYLTDEWYAAAVHIESRELLAAVNDTLARLQESGEMAEIQARWLQGQ